MKFCANCGAEIPDIAKFCPKCGALAEMPTCPACGGEVDLGQTFCMHCGANLKETSAPAAPSEPASEAWQEAVPAPAPETPKEAPPTPELPPKKKVEPPPVCPRCGKQTVSGYEHCVYCGTYWDQETKPKPVKSAAGSAQTQPQTRQTAPAPESETWRDISWTYRRALMRWSMHMAIHAEVDDKQLRCTSTSKILGQTDVAEEQMELESISKIVLVSKASFMMWTAISLMLSVFVAMLALPMFGVSLAISGGELVLTSLFLAGLCALMVWWVRFNLYHHRMVITGTGESGQKEIVLEALKPAPLKELQEELTRRTGVQLPRQNESTGNSKAFFGATVGVCLGIALAIFVAGQMPPMLSDGSATAGPGYIPPKVTPAPNYPERSKVDYEDYLLDELDIFTQGDRQTFKNLLETWDYQYGSIVAMAVVNWGADYETRAKEIWNSMDLRDSDALIFYDSSQDFLYLLHGGSFPVEADAVLTEFDFQEGQSRYISEILMNTLAGVDNLYRGGTPHSANDSPDLSRIAGTYTRDQSFQNPDGTWTDFAYTIGLEPVTGGLRYTYEWRGNICTDVVIPSEDIAVEDSIYEFAFWDDEGQHTVTVFPADPSSTGGGGQLYLDQDGPYEQW